MQAGGRYPKRSQAPWRALKEETVGRPTEGQGIGAVVETLHRHAYMGLTFVKHTGRISEDQYLQLCKGQ
jgi:hypothetical protein